MYFFSTLYRSDWLFHSITVLHCITITVDPGVADSILKTTHKTVQQLFDFTSFKKYFLYLYIGVSLSFFLSYLLLVLTSLPFTFLSLLSFPLTSVSYFLIFISSSYVYPPFSFLSRCPSIFSIFSFTFSTPPNPSNLLPLSSLQLFYFRRIPIIQINISVLTNILLNKLISYK